MGVFERTYVQMGGGEGSTRIEIITYIPLFFNSLPDHVIESLHSGSQCVCYPYFPSVVSAFIDFFYFYF